MPILWSEINGGYEPIGLAAAADAPMEGMSAVPGGRSWVVPFRSNQRQEYVLVSGLDVSINVSGLAIVGGLRVLQHKDEIVVGSQRMFFSNEATPVVEAYTHDATQRRPQCPVCRAQIQDGDQIVRCPGCTRLYHQITATDHSPEKFCWTYVPRCRFCEHPTSLSGDLAWRPDAAAVMERLD